MNLNGRHVDQQLLVDGMIRGVVKDSANATHE
jgi:hypothetical protein